MGLTRKDDRAKRTVCVPMWVGGQAGGPHTPTNNGARPGTGAWAALPLDFIGASYVPT